jgi:hypothetical protein
MKRLEEEISGQHSAGGFQVRVKRKNGQLFDARMYVSPLIDATGKQTGWMTSMTDITEPNRIREQLASSHERFTIVLKRSTPRSRSPLLGSQRACCLPTNSIDCGLARTQRDICVWCNKQVPVTATLSRRVGRCR